MTADLEPPTHRLPMLDFVTSQGDGLNLHTPVDVMSPTDPRERAICRALLQHALALLDASEPTQPVGSAR
jgi:hypothetical protein